MYLTFVFFIPENDHMVFRNIYELIVHMNYFFTMSQQP